MDLLIIKNEEAYLRVKENAFIAVGLDKASVFPMGQVDRVKSLLKEAQSEDFPKAVIRRLTLTESPFEENAP